MFQIHLIGDPPDRRTAIDLATVHYITEHEIESQEEGRVKVILLGFHNGMKMTIYDRRREMFGALMQASTMGLNDDDSHAARSF